MPNHGGSWVKPESVMKNNRKAASAPRVDDEALREATETAEVQAKMDRARTFKDQIGELFGGGYFITNWTDPILFHPILGTQQTVTRFYPQALIAVDIYPTFSEQDRKMIEFKRAAFREKKATFGGHLVKVRYGALQYTDGLEVLMPQVEA